MPRILKRFLQVEGNEIINFRPDTSVSQMILRLLPVLNFDDLEVGNRRTKRQKNRRALSPLSSQRNRRGSLENLGSKLLRHILGPLAIAHQGFDHA